ncbi:MAG TPA: hypothetical protein VD757_01840, partial [Candidatus Nitrosocosmicus sp.]|nr:hypothetical protein [Candidatus Nitrosocosmicus sp.]
FSIALLKINIILIPFIGALYVGYVHDRNYKSERRSILRNFVLGISCSLQFPAAYVGIALIGILKEGELLLLPSVLSELAMLILRQPAKHAVMIFLFIGCILWMTFMDVSFRAQRQWKKLFMKRLDNYYYERRSHIYEIYLVDPADYDENREGNLIAAFGVGYLIERDGKKPGAFYIPKEGIEELGIILPEVIEVTIDNMVYLKLDLGGRGDIEPYAYKGALICNKDKEAQQLEIEYL